MLEHLSHDSQAQENLWKMRVGALVKGEYDERLQQLAGEVALRAIMDLRTLRRRGVVKCMKIVASPELINLRDMAEYKNVHQVQKLLGDFKNGTVGWWCRAAGVRICNRTLLRRMQEENYVLS